jgi:hypothetical protein
VGGGMKMTRDLTALSRVTLSKTTAVDGERIYDNLMFGVAWRETDRNQWNALGKVQLIRDMNTALSLAPVNDTKAAVFALATNYQANKKLILSGRVALKLATDTYGSYSLNLTSLRATYDLTDKIDIGATLSRFSGIGGTQSGVGLEAGYLLGRGLWASLGFNWYEVRDRDLLDSDYGSRGVYLRLRYKFDEGLFAGKPSQQAASQAKGAQ